MSTEEKTSLADDAGEIYDALASEVEEEVIEEVAENPEEQETASDEVIVIEASDEDEEATGETDEVEVEAKETEPEAEKVDEEEVVEDDVEPLAHWLRKDKEMFKGLPREAKEFLIERDKEFQRHANDKVQESLAIKRALEPLRDELTQYGVSDDQAVRTLVGAHKMLQNNPKDGIKHLMNQYQISPEVLFGDEETAQPATDPRVDAIENKVSLYEQQLAQREQASLAGRLEEFKKNAEFFDDVINEMTEIAYVERMKNPNVIPDLEAVYKKACRANDKVWEVLLKRERESAGKAKSVERSKAAAGTRVKTTPESKRPRDKAQTGDAIRDDLSAIWDELAEKQKTGIAL